MIFSLGIALVLRKARKEILAYHKSALCRSASSAFSFILAFVDDQ